MSSPRHLCYCRRSTSRIHLPLHSRRQRWCIRCRQLLPRPRPRRRRISGDALTRPALRAARRQLPICVLPCAPRSRASPHLLRASRDSTRSTTLTDSAPSNQRVTTLTSTCAIPMIIAPLAPAIRMCMLMRILMRMCMSMSTSNLLVQLQTPPSVRPMLHLLLLLLLLLSQPPRWPFNLRHRLRSTTITITTTAEMPPPRVHPRKRELITMRFHPSRLMRARCRYTRRSLLALLLLSLVRLRK